MATKWRQLGECGLDLALERFVARTILRQNAGRAGRKFGRRTRSSARCAVRPVASEEAINRRKERIGGFHVREMTDASKL